MEGTLYISGCGDFGERWMDTYKNCKKSDMEEILKGYFDYPDYNFVPYGGSPEIEWTKPPTLRR